MLREHRLDLVGGAVPTGQVTFSLAGTVLGRVTLTNGTALFTTTALVVGNNTITVNYGGDATYTQARPVTNSIYIYEDGPVPTAATGTLSTQIAGTINPGVIEVTVSNPTLKSVIGQGTINIFATQTGVVDAILATRQVLRDQRPVGPGQHVIVQRVH